jgi:hypothetical protein
MGASGNLGATTTAILKNNHAAKQSNVTYKNTLIQTATFIVFISIQSPFILPYAAFLRQNGLSFQPQSKFFFKVKSRRERRLQGKAKRAFA